MKACSVVMIFGLIALANAGGMHRDRDTEMEHHNRDIDYHVPDQNSFEYEVNDPLSGNQQSRGETRRGDTVQGYYKVKEADGTMRRVHYMSDRHGLKTVVTKTGYPSGYDSDNMQSGYDRDNTQSGYGGEQHLRPMHHH